MASTTNSLRAPAAADEAGSSWDNAIEISSVTSDDDYQQPAYGSVHHTGTFHPFDDPSTEPLLMQPLHDPTTFHHDPLHTHPDMFAQPQHDTTGLPDGSPSYRIWRDAAPPYRPSYLDDDTTGGAQVYRPLPSLLDFRGATDNGSPYYSGHENLVPPRTMSSNSKLQPEDPQADSSALTGYATRDEIEEANYHSQEILYADDPFSYEHSRPVRQTPFILKLKGKAPKTPTTEFEPTSPSPSTYLPKTPEMKRTSVSASTYLQNTPELGRTSVYASTYLQKTPELERTSVSPTNLPRGTKRRAPDEPQGTLSDPTDQENRLIKPLKKRRVLGDIIDDITAGREKARTDQDRCNEPSSSLPPIQPSKKRRALDEVETTAARKKARTDQDRTNEPSSSTRGEEDESTLLGDSPTESELPTERITKEARDSMDDDEYRETLNDAQLSLYSTFIELSRTITDRFRGPQNKTVADVIGQLDQDATSFSERVDQIAVQALGPDRVQGHAFVYSRMMNIAVQCSEVKHKLRDMRAEGKRSMLDVATQTMLLATMKASFEPLCEELNKATVGRDGR